MPAIAGQAMNSWLPRGAVGAIEKGGAVLAGASGMLSPQSLLAAPFMSPRLMGEAAYGMGRLSGAGRGALSNLGAPPMLGGGQGQLSDFIMANPVLRDAILQMNR